MSSIPVSSKSFRQTLGFSSESILHHSSRNLSIDMDAVFLRTSGLCRAEKVSPSIENPSCPANLTARTGLSPSSPNLSNGEPTVLIIFFFMSSCPPNGSTRCPSSRSAAIAFIVKSRLERSSSIVAAYFTLSGCRPSVYPLSVRNVVVSISFPNMCMVTVPCAMPVGITLRKIFMTSWGVASVARSQSCPIFFLSMSLTAPPTRYALKPCCLKISPTFFSSVGIAIEFMVWNYITKRRK